MPEDMPLNEMKRVEQAYETRLRENEVYCAKVHLLLNPCLPDTKIIFSYRDVRDSLLSYMRFTHSDFERSMKMAVGMMEATDFYFQRHQENILRIKFDDIVQAPIVVIKTLAEFLQHPLDDDCCRQIAGSYSKENVTKVLSQVNKVKVDLMGQLEERWLNENYTVVGNFDGTHRVVDKKTRFQSNHITSKKDGEWRDVLTEAQQARIMEMARGWLLRYGFPL